MRVLAYTATYGDLMREETRASLRGQVFGGSLTCFTDRTNPFPPPDARNLLPMYEGARQMALDGGYDALLTVEHDMWLPEGAVERLVGVEADVVYGVYLLRHGALTLNTWAYDGSQAVGESLSLPRFRRTTRQAIATGGVMRVSGVGFGCTLIHRAALEMIPFRDATPNAPDIPFAQDCLERGLVSAAHFGVLCGHWDVERGRWLWPLERRELALVRVRMLKNIVIPLDDGVQRLEAGQVYELGEQDATDICRAGYATVMV